jgi:selenocysteine lyase/cysteine desulfurase
MRGRLRAAVAALLGGRPDDVALVSGATAGIQAVALCLPWQRGDRVVLLEGEFPANVTPWQRAAALFDLELAWIPVAAFQGSSGDGLSRLEAELRRGARLLATSAVQFRTGLAMPLREMAALAARHGAEIFVDAIQACGATPLDAAGLGLDYVASGAHKWLMGIHGAGFLWLSPGRAPALRPHLAGWLSHEDPVSFLTRGPGHLRYDRPIRPTTAALEGGSSSEVGQAALLAALELLLGLGIPAIHAHANAFLDRLAPGLAARGFALTREADPARRSSFCSAAPPPGVDAVRLQGALSARGVAVSLPDGLLRFAPHWPNALGEVELVLAALDEGLAGQGRGR